MRRKEEIERQIKGLEKTIIRLKENGGVFAEDSIKKIELQIDIISGKDTYLNHKDDEEDMEISAYDAELWLSLELDEDLFD